ncbi:hypothetical protein [Thalassospira lucentensis]|uniref:hypothetical protein n=1 Tax=Thalassospira lucentensis TaxID=168935 RepID=UPI00142DC0EE|nr:hypothetical protein [Thalassospira lucentensis]NIZ03928.1 hypothetical protein [Thalassospira lucentensis]
MSKFQIETVSATLARTPFLPAPTLRENEAIRPIWSLINRIIYGQLCASINEASIAGRPTIMGARIFWRYQYGDLKNAVALGLQSHNNKTGGASCAN